MVKDVDSFIRSIAGYDIDTRTNTISNGTIPVTDRSYSSTLIPDNEVKCIDLNGRFINVERFSPGINDLDMTVPKYKKEWEVYDNPNSKNKKIIKIKYPGYYKRWWYKQRKRCIEGYEVGGVKITGIHYFYLNFWRIKMKSKGAGYKPPRFLDCDKEFFDAVKEAKDTDKNLMILKRRQIGFSEKCACICAHEFTFYAASESLIIAGEEKYSAHTFGKTIMGLDYLSPSSLNAGREFYKRRGKDISNELAQAYYLHEGAMNGYMSQIHCITTKDNTQAASGKSPTVVIMEEFGINPLGRSVSNMILPSLQEQGKQNGRIMIYIGTGGEMGKGVDQMKKMFYNPRGYNLLPFINKWDDPENDTLETALFFPCWKYYVTDNDGNSYKEPGMALWSEEYEVKKNDKKDAQEYLTQMPRTTMDAFSVSGLCPFNTIKLRAAEKRIMDNHRNNQMLEKWGRFVAERGPDGRINKVTFEQAITEGEIDKDGDELYPVKIMEFPEWKDDEDAFVADLNKDLFYKDLYFGGTDSYDKDKANSSDSKGAFSIFKGYKDSGSTSMFYPCSINWRPVKKEKFFEQVALACLFYGGRRFCKNLIEWSNITIFDYHKNENIEFLCKERPDFTYANKIQNSVVENQYGIDPNTRWVWVDHYAECIEDYAAEHWVDLHGVSRALNWKSNTKSYRHNCDYTISRMLAYENYLDWHNNIRKKYATGDDEDEGDDYGFGYYTDAQGQMQNY